MVTLVQGPPFSEATLPSLYAPWLRSICGGPIPAESMATCSNCAMLPSPGDSTGVLYFHPATKCCAFQPQLPNFLAGRILSDTAPALALARTELENRISRRVAVSPAWAGPGAVFGLLYQNTPGVFGRAPELRCHFLTPQGDCGIWQHRPGVCATWYCKHVRGEVGQRFWSIAEKLLRQVEQELSQWCLAELNTGLAEVGGNGARHLPDVSELGGEIDWTKYRELWGEWAGREVDFYRTCAELVAPLDWEHVQQICGPRVRILKGLLRDAFDAFDHLSSYAIPERLCLGEFRFTGVAADGFRVCGYSSYDPLMLPEALARALPYFDGRSTEDALEAISREQGLHIELNLIRRMLDFGLLRAYSEPNILPILS